MDRLKVFVNEKVDFGNPLGIVVDEKQKLITTDRQKITKNSGLSEVVFIDSVEKRQISIYSPTRQIPFAGHAAVGAAYYLAEVLGHHDGDLISMGEKIEVWQEDKLFWVRAKINNLPEWNLIQVESEGKLLAIDSRRKVRKHAFMWTWLDENEGKVRARTLAPDWGIVEDEANGSGSMKLAMKLKRELVILHGKGSVIYTRPRGVSNAEVGGRVKS